MSSSEDQLFWGSGHCHFAFRTCARIEPSGDGPRVPRTTPSARPAKVRPLGVLATSGGLAFQRPAPPPRRMLPPRPPPLDHAVAPPPQPNPFSSSPPLPLLL